MENEWFKLMLEDHLFFYKLGIYHAELLKSTLISIPFGIVIDVTSFIWAAVHSKSMYRLNTVISQLSQVFEPSPHGVLRQQILRCLLGNLTGPLSLTPAFFAFPTRLLVTVWMAWRVAPLKVILVCLISWSSMIYFLSLSAIRNIKN
jgi:hypothetical protein